MSNKTKILILMPSMSGGGAERILINVLNSIDFNLFEIDLLVAVKKGSLLNQVPKQVRVLSLFKSEFIFRMVTRIQKEISFHWLQKYMFNKVVRKAYEVGVSYLDGNMTDYLHYSKKLNKKIAWVHSSYVSNRNFAKFYESKAYVEKLKKKRYLGLNKICFVSEDCKSEFVEVFGEYKNMEVVYNFINTADIKEKSLITPTNTNYVFTFVAIGSLISVKGYDLLIDSVKRIASKGLIFKVQIIGEGSQAQYLKKRVEIERLSSFVEFLGFMSNPYGVLKNSDAFVMTSISEANPTALCEALVLGKASLVVDVPGCREIIGQGKFGLLSKRNVVSFANNMEELIVNPSLKSDLEKKALIRSKDFDDSKILNAYLNIFQL